MTDVSVRETQAQQQQQQQQPEKRSVLRWLHGVGLAPLIVLLVLMAVVAAYDSTFLETGSLLSLLEQAAPLALLALAQAVIVFTGRIHLANAGLATLSAVVLAQGLGSWGPAAIPIVLLGAAVCGLLIGALQVLTQVPSFIITLGFLGLFAGLSLWISKADSILVTSGYESISWIDLRIFGIPISFAIVVVVTLVLMGMFVVLPLGRRVFAIGLNERAAAYSGIRTGRIVIGIFCLSGALSGLAALVQVAQLQSAGASTLDSLLLPSIAAVIVGGSSISGGVGGLGRTLIGALVIAVLRVGLDIVGVNPAFQPILYGLIVIGAIAITVDRRSGAIVA